MRAVVVSGGLEVYITDHALERWGERAKPALMPDELLDDLRRVLGVAGRPGPMPPWAAVGEYVSAWVWVGDDYVFPVRDGRLVTCLTRGYPSDGMDERINVLQQKRRAAKNARGTREKHGKVARAGRVERRRRAESLDG